MISRKSKQKRGSVTLPLRNSRDRRQWTFGKVISTTSTCAITSSKRFNYMHRNHSTPIEYCLHSMLCVRLVIPAVRQRVEQITNTRSEDPRSPSRSSSQIVSLLPTDSVLFRVVTNLLDIPEIHQFIILPVPESHHIQGT